MSGPPNNDDGADREGFTCSALLMCLYQPGRSKKKPEEDPEARTSSRPQVESMGPAPDQQPNEAEQEPAHAPSRRASFEKFECASLSGNNIVFDFVEEDQAAQAGYCPSPCFDLPVELIRAGERYGAVAASDDAPVTAAFVFGDYQGAALKKMASCLAAGVEEARRPHLVRFLSSAAGSSAPPRPPATPSRAELPKGTAVGEDRVHHQPAGFPEQETVV